MAEQHSGKEIAYDGQFVDKEGGPRLANELIDARASEGTEDIWGDAEEVAKLAEPESTKKSRWQQFREQRQAKRDAARKAVENIPDGFTDAPDPAVEAIWDQPVSGAEQPAPAATEEAAPSFTPEEVEAVDWDEKF